jgi:hypothetical protein
VTTTRRVYQTSHQAEIHTHRRTVRIGILAAGFSSESFDRVVADRAADKEHGLKFNSTGPTEIRGLQRNSTDIQAEVGALPIRLSYCTPGRTTGLGWYRRGRRPFHRRPAIVCCLNRENLPCSQMSALDTAWETGKTPTRRRMRCSSQCSGHCRAQDWRGRHENAVGIIGVSGFPT